MTPQEAYVKGLNDAENRMISAMNKYMSTDEYDPFQNPVLEDTWQKFIKFQNSRVVRKLLRGSPPPQEELLLESISEEDTAEDIFVKKVNLVNENSQEPLKKVKKTTKSKAGLAKE